MLHLSEMFWSSIKFGEMQKFRAMSVTPILAAKESEQDYLSLKKALNQHLLTITEVSESGSVPNLKVINNADKPVLLLDGEEISGAKQNRILNTSILLKEHSDTIIPVSCTERGRWSYDRPNFEESGNVMSAQVRSAKMVDVSQSLKSGGSFRSDQGKVWSEIDKLSSRLEVSSETDAMKDVIDSSRDRLHDYVTSFPLLDNQVGVAVCIEDRVVGVDCLSRPDVWEDLHEKLIVSYAIDCLGRNLKDNSCQITKVIEFIKLFAECNPEVFPSVGYGDDYRFESYELIGAGLVWQGSIVHLAIYPRNHGMHDVRYHSPRRR